MRAFLIAAFVTALCSTTATAEEREAVRVVGSSTVYPYTVAVAERFAAAGTQPMPEVRSTGTGSGFVLFCEGIGPEFPDITGASRPMRLEEWRACRENDVGDITQAKIGFDGLTIAYAKAGGRDWSLKPSQLYMALAATVPVDGEAVPNPYQRWSEIDPALPDVPIKVMGPPQSSGTRDSFIELVLEPGCEIAWSTAGSSPAEPDTTCGTLRADGPFVEAGEDDTEIVAALEQDPELLGVFGYLYVYQNDATLAGAAVNGVAPSFVTIATGNYPLARPLFIYVKNAHRDLVTSLRPFLAEYMGDAILPYGYLPEEGLTPILDDDEREQIVGATLDGIPMSPPEE